MQYLDNKIILFDGGMGSQIDALGLKSDCPEDLNITNKEDIINIHKSYSESDIITTNTFGLNRLKYKGKYNIKDVAIAAIENAKETNKKVFFDIGPTGLMLKPIGTLDFDDAYDAFKEIVLFTKDLVDGYIVETFSDLYELKACILAIKENSNKPIFATMVFDNSMRTLTGTTPEIMVNTLEGLGVDALGINCSLGPKDMLECIKRIVKASHIRVMVQPNRGLPKIKNGKAYYDLAFEEFDYYINEFVNLGVTIIGGCCGTTPEFINGLAKYKNYSYKLLDNKYETIINSATNLVLMDDVRVCGERLNPTGKKKLKAAIIEENYEYLVSEAIKQEELSDLLDVNVGLPKIDEPRIMKNTICKIQEYVSIPLQIDSSDKNAIELGCRYYNGIPIINSVNGDDEVMDNIFPIAKKYGAVVLGLCLDKNGVPKTCEERFEIAKRIINKAKQYGIPSHKIMIDTLVLTASAEQELVNETIKALKLVRTLGVKTALGVSNVSFGLPNRLLLNKVFLAMAMYNGLNMPIINPLDTEMMNTIYAYRALMNIDKNCSEYINKVAYLEDLGTKVNDSLSLYDAIIKGIDSNISALVNKELEVLSPLDIVDNILIKALNDVGASFEKGKIFLPQLIKAAEASKKAFDIIGSKLPKENAKNDVIIIATVKGDVHDIGKNICKVVLESYGYKVIDLGKDVDSNTIIEAYHKHMPTVIGLSALMTTTVVSMENIIKELRKIDVKSKIVVGGAVLTALIAEKIDADFYAKDANALVSLVNEITKK